MIDLILAAVLLAGAVIGGIRGLFKSLMGLGVLIAALVGAVLLANLLTGPITELVAPRVEDAIVSEGVKLTETIVKEGSAKASAERDALLEKYVGSADWRERIGKSLDFTAGTEDVAERAEKTIREAVAPGVRKVVESAVHAILLLVLYLALTVALRLAVRALDHVFDLPVLATLNGVGGAVLGFLEAALVLLVVLRVCAALGVEPVAANAGESALLPFFLGDSPSEPLSLLSH